MTAWVEWMAQQNLLVCRDCMTPDQQPIRWYTEQIQGVCDLCGRKAAGENLGILPLLSIVKSHILSASWWMQREAELKAKLKENANGFREQMEKIQAQIKKCDLCDVKKQEKKVEKLTARAIELEKQLEAIAKADREKITEQIREETRHQHKRFPVPARQSKEGRQLEEALEVMDHHRNGMPIDEDEDDFDFGDNRK